MDKGVLLQDVALDVGQVEVGVCHGDVTLWGAIIERSMSGLRG